MFMIVVGFVEVGEEELEGVGYEYCLGGYVDVVVFVVVCYCVVVEGEVEEG